MKKIFLIIGLLFLSTVSYGQDSIKKRMYYPQFQISVQAGGMYENFLGNRYIDPAKSTTVKEHKYDGYTKMPTFGYKAGFLINIKIIKNLYVTTGSFFCFRKEVYENSLDTINKYGLSKGTGYIPETGRISNIIRYDYSSYDIELPIMLLFRWKRLNIYAGAYFPMLIYRKAIYTYNYKTAQIPLGADCKKFSEFELPIKVYPSFHISYVFNIRKHTIEPYVGMDFGAKKSFYVQGGLIFSVYNYLK
jgi:hypothetical protein